MLQTVSVTGPPSVRTVQERIRSEKLKQTIAASRLRFDRLGLCGRNDEVDKLKACFSRMNVSLSNDTASSRQLLGSRKRQPRELVLIGGESGTGKTSLALKLKQPVKAANGVFCSGKYDLNMRDEPLVGVSVACNELCRHVLALQSDEVQAIRKEILDLGPSVVGLLVEMSGDVQTILEGAAQKDEPQERRRYSGGDGKKNRLLAAMRSFFRIITNHLSPVVVLLDDLQWADVLSLECIEALLLDDEIMLMIIGCFRSNEVDEQHVLSVTAMKLKQQAEKEELQVTECEVGNLTADDVKQMVLELLGETDSAEVENLAKLCHNRTEGNVFFVRAFLTMLVDEGHLKLNVSSFQWQWNAAVIEQSTSATPNLVSMIQRRMRRLSGDVDIARLLEIASCLGNTFDSDTLRLVWEKLKLLPDDEAQDRSSSFEQALAENSTPMVADSDAEEEFQRLLDVAMQSNCLEAPVAVMPKHADGKNTSLTLRFAHDKIQEAAIHLVPAEEYCWLQFRVGLVLRTCLSQEKLDSMLFVVAWLLQKSPQKRVDVAELILKAAQKARFISAHTAAHFVRTGLDQLKHRDMWNSHFNLALDLHSIGARAEMDIGNVDASNAYCAAVLQQKGATPLQRCPIWRVKQLLLHNEGQMREALDFSLKCLRELGCEFPRMRQTKVRLYMEETKTNFVPSLEQVLALPMMTDPTKIETMKILEEAGSLAFVLHDSSLYTMIRCRVVRWVVLYGLTDESGPAFASLGNVMMHRYKLFDTGKQLAELALEVQELCGSKFSEARTIGTAHGYVLSWVEPVQSRLKYFIQGYNSGLLSGNIFSACTCLPSYTFCQFRSGANLATIKEDCETFAAQLDQLAMHLISDIQRPTWQVVENLIGSNCTTELTGNAMTEHVYRTSPRTKSLVVLADLFKAIACMFFSKFEEGAAIALKLGPDGFRNALPGISFGYEYLPFGVCLYAMARKRPRKFKPMANRIRSELHSLVKKGCINLVHHLHFLDAEFFAVNRKVEQAKEAFTKAAKEAARGGFLGDLAFVHERFSVFLIHQRDHRGVSFRLREAIKCYNDWGAKAKVEILREKHRVWTSSLTNHTHQININA